MVYLAVLLSVIAGMISLAVDFGRVELVNGELNAAADASAMYAALTLGSDALTVRTAANAVAQQNRADGRAVQLLTQDVQIGRWDTASRTFTVFSDVNATSPDANAVRVRATRLRARGEGVPMFFAQLFGVTQVDAAGESVAVQLATKGIDVVVGAQSCPWLAGMPAGKYGTCSAPLMSPNEVLTLDFEPGDKVQFLNCAGNIYVPGWGDFSVEGRDSHVISNDARYGISKFTGPCHAMVGIFLDDRRPDTWATPPAMNFSTSASRDFTTLSPQLKQVFFIGDGKRLDGVTVQTFVVPAGATRLFLGNFDDYRYYADNTGQFQGCTPGKVAVRLVR